MKICNNFPPQVFKPSAAKSIAGISTSSDPDFRQSTYSSLCIQGEQNRCLVNFRGIKDDYGRACYSDSLELSKVVKTAKNDPELYVMGSLPKPWEEAMRKKFSSEKEFQTKSTELSKGIAGAFKTPLAHYEPDAAQPKAAKLFMEMGIIDNKKQLRVSKNLPEGGYGKVAFLHDAKNNVSLALKFFHQNEFFSPLEPHGIFAEANRMAYFKQNIKEHNRVKFHFANLKDEFCVCDYYDYTKKYDSPKTNLNALGLLATDDNTLNNDGEIFVDYGGLFLVNPCLNSKPELQDKFLNILEANDPESKAKEYLKDFKGGVEKSDSAAVLVGVVGEKSFSKEFRGEIVDALLENADNDTKKLLASALPLVARVDKFDKVFDVLVKDKSDAMRKLLAASIAYVPLEEKQGVLPELSRTKNKDIAAFLASMLPSIDVTDQTTGAHKIPFEVFENLASLKDEQTSELLLEYVEDILCGEEYQKAMGILSQGVKM